jgi:hypothetical protein
VWFAAEISDRVYARDRFFAAALSAAQRFFVAAMIAARPAALSRRFFFGAAGVLADPLTAAHLFRCA